jgi:DNA-binding HxlR family transcriptional regulator
VVHRYGQYCPVARTSEVLAERWTPLVVRNLLFGADTFSAIAGGVPSMSRTLLSRRLAELERAGLVTRTPKERGRGWRYGLTEAGRDLAPVMEAMAAWGERWVEVGEEHTDPGFALWAWCQVQLDRGSLPVGRHVVAFDFHDQPAGNRHFWLLVEHGGAQVCYSDPGGEPGVTVRAESAAFVAWHRGRLPWRSALRSGRIEVSGDRALRSSLPRWNLREPQVAGPAG